MRRWAPTIVMLALLAGTAVAFATTERQKLEKTPFDVLRVDPTFSPRTAPATIELKLRHPQFLTVRILDGKSRTVATLARDRRFNAGVVDFRWRGGVNDGTYAPVVTLGDGRVFRLQNPIVFDSTPPRATLVSYRPRRVLQKRRVRIAYRVNEPAHVLLYVNGQRVLISRATALRARIQWFPRRGGVPLPRGRYRLQLAALDLAGNVGPLTPVFVVRVR